MQEGGLLVWRLSGANEPSTLGMEDTPTGNWERRVEGRHSYPITALALADDGLPAPSRRVTCQNPPNTCGGGGGGSFGRHRVGNSGREWHHQDLIGLVVVELNHPQCVCVWRTWCNIVPILFIFGWSRPTPEGGAVHT